MLYSETTVSVLGAEGLILVCRRSSSRDNQTATDIQSGVLLVLHSI